MGEFEDMPGKGYSNGYYNDFCKRYASSFSLGIFARYLYAKYQ